MGMGVGKMCAYWRGDLDDIAVLTELRYGLSTQHPKLSTQNIGESIIFKRQIVNKLA